MVINVVPMKQMNFRAAKFSASFCSWASDKNLICRNLTCENVYTSIPFIYFISFLSCLSFIIGFLGTLPSRYWPSPDLLRFSNGATMLGKSTGEGLVRRLGSLWGFGGNLVRFWLPWSLDSSRRGKQVYVRPRALRGKPVGWQAVSSALTL